MFSSGSPYSPFFTSGFLSPSPLQLSSSQLAPRRGSLPTDSPAQLVSPVSPTDAPAFYCALQPKRDPNEYRSFLSLDLAESNSLRTLSVNRVSHPSAARQSSAILPPIPEAPPKPLRVHRSRDSLRSIPSPKPAPSATLPEIPVASPSAVSSAPPRLPSIAIQSGLNLSLYPSRPPSSTKPNKSANRCSTSTVSTRARRVNRSHALARLEGRTSSIRRQPTRPAKHSSNFMSMSDDEADEEDISDHHRSFGDNRGLTLSAILEPEDVVFPLEAGNASQYPKSAPVDGRFPMSVISNHHRNQPSQSSQNTVNTTSEWFPLKSFIDLNVEDDMSRWSWRSFVEVAKVS